MLITIFYIQKRIQYEAEIYPLAAGVTAFCVRMLFNLFACTVKDRRQPHNHSKVEYT